MNTIYSPKELKYKDMSKTLRQVYNPAEWECSSCHSNSLLPIEFGCNMCQNYPWNKNSKLTGRVYKSNNMENN